ncbi:NAD-dependent epimerase/dehydratase family protein [Candidatus Omnitrophota bacterium]
MKKNVLITGVAGLIGSHLLDRLLFKSKYKVYGIDNLSVGSLDNIKYNLKNKNFKFHKIDILDLKKMQKVLRRIDIIIHLAAAKKVGEVQSAITTLITNTKGTENILHLAEKNKAKVIIASTSDVYGLSEDLPFQEDNNLVVGPPTAKRWAYAASKMYDEQLAMAYYKEKKLKVVILRYFGGFSARSNKSWSGGHIPIFIDKVLNDEIIPIHGDGRQTRSMAYIDDIVRGTVLAMEKEKAVGEIINLGNDEEMAILDYVRLIHKLAKTGKKLRIKFIPMKNIFGDYKEIKRRIPDLTKAKRLLKYYPKVSIEDGIKITIDEMKRKTDGKNV